MTLKISQENDREICHYFRYTVVIGTKIGKLRLHN